ncbi:MAG: cell division protein FtsZ [Anaerolineales bacterium]|nr:cell division protein FtsZ [Anaerolineales bacterium]
MDQAFHNAPTQPTRVRTPIHQPVLKVIGLGGGGGNAVDRMIELGIKGIEFITANTDHQALARSQAPIKIQLGLKATRGLGAGGNPQVGRQAAEESWRAIAQALAGADMVFLTAGMGGGTGTGAIPIATQIAKAQGAVAIAVVTTPFSFEMGRRQKNAQAGLSELRKHTDTLITIPNDRLLYVAPPNLPLDTAFRLADDVLRQAVQSITELITEPGLINIDFAHIRRLMKLGGGALMAIGYGQGEHKAQAALEQALNHPLLETVSLNHAAGVIVNFTAGSDLTLMEVSEALNYLQSQANPATEIVMGTTQDERLRNRVQAILVVTGLGATSLEEVMPGIQKPVTRAAGQAPVRRLVTEAEQQPPLLQPAGMPHDLDLPAFMRRGSRTTGQL